MDLYGKVGDHLLILFKNDPTFILLLGLSTVCSLILVLFIIYRENRRRISDKIKRIECTIFNEQKAMKKRYIKSLKICEKLAILSKINNYQLQRNSKIISNNLQKQKNHNNHIIDKERVDKFIITNKRKRKDEGEIYNQYSDWLFDTYNCEPESKKEFFNYYFHKKPKN